MSAMKATQNTRKGIWLMAGSAAIFALQDGVSRHLGSNYSVYMVVMIRFWVFAAFVMLLAWRRYKQPFFPWSAVKWAKFRDETIAARAR